MSKTVAYVRVSTDDQDARNQKFEILTYCDQHKWQIDTWLESAVSSRRSTKERRLDELLSTLETGDRLIVAELSRIGRSTGEVIQLVNDITASNVEFIAIKQGLRINAHNGQDIASKVIVTIFSLLAELERDLISERTKIALSRAKAAGKKLGRPKGPGKSKLDGKEAEITHLLGKGVTRANIAKILGVAWGTLNNFIKTRGLLIQPMTSGSDGVME
jgi:DNA invertase Pin-like site-specific DNA recombinase